MRPQLDLISQATHGISAILAVESMFLAAMATKTMTSAGTCKLSQASNPERCWSMAKQCSEPFALARKA